MPVSRADSSRLPVVPPTQRNVSSSLALLACQYALPHSRTPAYFNKTNHVPCACTLYSHSDEVSGTENMNVQCPCCFKCVESVHSTVNHFINVKKGKDNFIYQQR
jgi:hypothetical protein